MPVPSPAGASLLLAWGLRATISRCHALAFPTVRAQRVYRTGARGINAVPASVFAFAGIRMLLAAQAR